MAKAHKAVVGIEWEAQDGAQVRHEPGDVCEPPADSLPWLLEQGLVEAVAAPSVAKEAKPKADKGVQKAKAEEPPEPQDEDSEEAA